MVGRIEDFYNKLVVYRACLQMHHSQNELLGDEKSIYLSTVFKIDEISDDRQAWKKCKVSRDPVFELRISPRLAMAIMTS